MRTLSIWPAGRLILLGGVGLLPTIAMIGLYFSGASWWGPRTSVVVGMYSFFFLELALLKPAAGLAGKIGYQLKVDGTRNLRAGLIAIATYMSVVHLVPAMFYVSVSDVLFPWGGSPTSRVGLETAAFLFLVFCLMFTFVVAVNFGSGYFKARRDARMGLPPKG